MTQVRPIRPMSENHGRITAAATYCRAAAKLLDQAIKELYQVTPSLEDEWSRADDLQLSVDRLADDIEKRREDR